MCPVGIYGSPAHILTNKNVDQKAKCLVDARANDMKRNAKILGFSAAVGGVAAGSTAVIQKVKPEVLPNAEKAIVDFGKNVLESAKTSLKASFEKYASAFKSLPAPAKAAIAVGGGILALASFVTPLLTVASNAKTEAMYEKQPD